MKDDIPYTMTPFDQYVTNHSLQMIKLFIPFLPPGTQRMMAVYVKFLEFQHTLSFFHSMKQCDLSSDDIYDNLKPYLSPEDQSTFEQMTNMMNMVNMMQDMPDMDFDPSILAGMFTQESKEGDKNE